MCVFVFRVSEMIRPVFPGSFTTVVLALLCWLTGPGPGPGGGDAYYVPAAWIGGTQGKNPTGVWPTVGTRVSPTAYYPNHRNFACVTSNRATAASPGAGTVWYGFGANNANKWFNDMWMYDGVANQYVSLSLSLSLLPHPTDSAID